MKVVVQEDGSVTVSNSWSNGTNGGICNITVSSPVSGGGGGGGGEPAEDFVETTGPSTCGSFVLAGNSSSSVGFSANAGFDFGTGPFTIEWWQYQTDNNSFPRVFARGTYGSTTIGLSIEGGGVYFWDAGANPMGTIGSYKNSWKHFAITRSINNKLRFFYNGTLVSTVENYTYNFTTSANNFMIGVEGVPSNSSSFGGNITNFHVMKGAARYVAPFTPSTTPLRMTNKSVLMMYADNTTDAFLDSTNTCTLVTSNAAWTSTNPFA
jgi:hypothetical protein